VQESDPAGVAQPETNFGCEHQQILELVHAVETGGSPSRKLKLVELEAMLMAVELLKWLAVAPVLVVLAIIRKDI
jgi:hypothetical protein